MKQVNFQSNCCAKPILDNGFCSECKEPCEKEAVPLSDNELDSMRADNCFNLISRVIESYFNKDIRLTDKKDPASRAIKPMSDDELNLIKSKKGVNMINTWCDCVKSPFFYSSEDLKQKILTNHLKIKNDYLQLRKQMYE